MSELNDFDTPDSPPPPAYEFCQEEFDRKVSYAIEESQNQSASADDEEWEVWDEAAFTAAASRLGLTDRGEGSSSSSRPETCGATRVEKVGRLCTDHAWPGSTGKNGGALTPARSPASAIASATAGS